MFGEKGRAARMVQMANEANNRNEGNNRLLFLPPYETTRGTMSFERKQFFKSKYFNFKQFLIC